MVEEERKKRGFDSQLVLYQLRLTPQKHFLVLNKTKHSFIMGTTADSENADRTTLKESADGSSLIFCSNNRSLVFDPLTLELTHNFNQRVTDIVGSTVLLVDNFKLYLSELSKIDEEPKPLSLEN